MHITFAHESLEEWARPGDAVRGLVELHCGVSFQCIILAPASYRRVRPPLK